MAIDMKAPPTQGFLCPGCGAIYDERWDASDCCSYDLTTNDAQVWECPSCDKRFPSRAEANACHGHEGYDPKQVAGFKCGSCGEMYEYDHDYPEQGEDARESAQWCCVSEYQRSGYGCKVCGNGWSSRREAVECCKSPEFVTVYSCTCGDTFGSKQEALDCCGDGF